MAQYRQGDVFLVAAEKPIDAKKEDATGDEVILAYGEATGHHHAVRAAAAIMYAATAARFLHVLRETELYHEEHSPILVPAGWYQVVRQREYTPEETRNVRD